MQFKVTATETTLSQHAFTDRVATDKLDGAGVRFAQIVQSFANRAELCAIAIDILLVYLICDDGDRILLAELDNFLNIVFLHDLPCRVAWVDNHDSTRTDALGERLLDLSLNVALVKGPSSLFIQVVGKQLSTLHRQEG